jgi:hypothetical protein
MNARAIAKDLLERIVHATGIRLMKLNEREIARTAPSRRAIQFRDEILNLFGQRGRGHDDQRIGGLINSQGQQRTGTDGVDLLDCRSDLV